MPAAADVLRAAKMAHLEGFAGFKSHSFCRQGFAGARLSSEEAHSASKVAVLAKAPLTHQHRSCLQPHFLCCYSLFLPFPFSVLFIISCRQKNSFMFPSTPPVPADTYVPF